MNTTVEMKAVVGSRPSDDQQPASRPTPSGGSTDPREFLLMRARQRQARARMRRWKIRGLAVAFCGLVVFSVVSSRKHRAAVRARAAAALAEKPPLATVVSSLDTHLPALVPAPVEVIPPLVGPEMAPAAAAGTAGSPCDRDFGQRQWRAAIDSCTQAFESTPGPALALRIAHAHWSHGQVANAGTWASKALALGTTDADAYVLVGHAERQAGHPKAARAAYRRYLRGAPRGWHASRVRAALRELSRELSAVSYQRSAPSGKLAAGR
jgi:hypothetical protein